MSPPVAFGVAAAAAAAYALLEPYRFRVRTLDVPLTRSNASATVLHLSDLHLNSRDRKLANFLRRLPDELATIPDLIAATGDLIEDNSGIEPLTEVFSTLEARHGKFYVLGSHDYYQTKFQTYAKYFSRSHRRPRAPRADTNALHEGLRSKGWTDLDNAQATVEAPFGLVRVSGVDDPFLDRHSIDHIQRDPADSLNIGLVHTPEVVSEWLLHGFDLVLAGHTHGGQVRLPVLGALVTNSKLPAGLGGGLHRVGAGWLHVSPGLGTGKFAPIRFNCPPEVTLLRLHPAA